MPTKSSTIVRLLESTIVTLTAFGFGLHPTLIVYSSGTITQLTYEQEMRVRASDFPKVTNGKNPETGDGRRQPKKLFENYNNIPLSFQANHAQSSSGVEFLARGNGYSVFLTASEMILSLRGGLTKGIDTDSGYYQRHTPATVRMRIIDGNPRTRLEGLERLPGKVNYLIGNDTQNWRTNLPTYARIKYNDVYPGIDLFYYGTQGQLEYDFVVAPGVDPDKIKLGFSGTWGLRVNSAGELLLDTTAGEVRWSKPRVYQEIKGLRKEIEGRYVLKSVDQIGFEVSAYDQSQPLVIDPVLVYSTFLGGANGEDVGHSITTDSAGNAYIAGYTSSSDFPTQNALQPSHQGPAPGQTEPAPHDAFISKLNSEGTALVFSTFLGGGDGDYAYSIKVNTAGSIYVSGATASNNFPVSVAPFQHAKSPASYMDAFMTKLSSDGSTIEYSTYLGGNGNDYGYALALGAEGDVYVAGQTASTNSLISSCAR